MQLNMFDMLSEVPRAAPKDPIFEPAYDFGATFHWEPAPAPVAANGGAIAACGRTRPADNPPAFDPPVDLVARGDDPGVSAPRVLADIVRMLDRDVDRSSIEMRSALKTLSRVLSRPLSDLPCDPEPLRVLIENAMPGLAGISNGRWSQVRSLTLRALKRCGVEVMAGRRRGGLDEAWAELNTKLVSHQLAYGLSRFLTYLSQKGATPQTVCSADFDRFQQNLLTASLLPKAEECYRTTVRLWNKAAATIDDWPQVTVDFSPDPRRYSLPWSAFPASFKADVEAYLAAKENPDPLSDDYSRPVSAATLENRRGGIHQLASALINSGFPADGVVNLGILVRSDNAKAALAWLRVRRGGDSPHLGNQARLLLIINRHWVRSAEDDAELKRFSSNLAVKKEGMTVKNRERLRQFDVDKNLTALLRLAPRVMKEVKTGGSGRSDAVRAMHAIAVEILLMSPIRVKNLVALELGRHLRLVGVGRHRHYVLSLSATETKNNTEFTAPLPLETTRLIDRYIEHFRDATTTGQSQLLFPGHGSGSRSTDAFSHGLCKFIRRETGLVMNVHLFRALAGKIYLGLNPHDIETVRQVLGHRNSATTLRAYTHLGAEQAAQRYDTELLRIRDGLKSKRATTPKKGTSK